MLNTVLIFVMLSVMIVHFKTESVKGPAIVWGLILSIIALPEGDWLSIILLGLSGFGVLWVLFSLANYLEDTIFLRLFVLLFTMGAMYVVPGLVVEAVSSFLA